MIYTVPLVQIINDHAVIKREIEVEADDAVNATFQAAAQITEDEESSVFAMTPAIP